MANQYSSYPDMPKQPFQQSYDVYSSTSPQPAMSHYPQQPAYNDQGGWGAPVYNPPTVANRFDQTPMNGGSTSGGRPMRQRLNPTTWSKRTRIIVGIVAAVVVIIAVVVGAVEGVKANRYPSYSPLQYNEVASINPSNFFSNFQYWDTYDPAQGFVHYDNPADAVSRNLTVNGDQSAILRVDNSPESTNEVTGRHTARVASKQTFNNGLFIFDIKHTPFGCGTWPAVWLSDQYSWPTFGEIDIIEAVNQANTGVESTLHTTNGCTMSVKRKMTGKSLNNNCWNGTDANAGCGVGGEPDTYGEALNSNGGGVYATEWRSDGIRIWFFPRNNLPSDVGDAISLTNTNSVSPDPSKWGEALADFPNTDCSIGSHFKNASIIANIDLCGQWAGRVYAQDKCPGDCKTYVAQNPAAFDNAFWEFGMFKVYQAPNA